MDFLQIVVVALGIAVVLGLVWILVSGGTIPPTVKMIVLIAAAVLLLICIFQELGCKNMPHPMPQTEQKG